LALGSIERDGAPLRGRTAGHGEPFRLVVPGERGDALGQAANAADERARIQVQMVTS